MRHTHDGERFDDFDIRQEWWTGDALPEAKVVRRELAGVPRVEVVGLSKEKVEELFWDTITQVRADRRAVAEVISAYGRRWKEIGMATRHCRPACVMIAPWIDVPWNGSATTS